MSEERREEIQSKIIWGKKEPKREEGIVWESFYDQTTRRIGWRAIATDIHNLTQDQLDQLKVVPRAGTGKVRRRDPVRFLDLNRTPGDKD